MVHVLFIGCLSSENICQHILTGMIRSHLITFCWKLLNLRVHWSILILKFVICIIRSQLFILILVSVSVVVMSKFFLSTRYYSLIFCLKLRNFVLCRFVYIPTYTLVSCILWMNTLIRVSFMIQDALPPPCFGHSKFLEALQVSFELFHWKWLFVHRGCQSLILLEISEKFFGFCTSPSVSWLSWFFSYPLSLFFFVLGNCKKALLKTNVLSGWEMCSWHIR